MKPKSGKIFIIIAGSISLLIVLAYFGARYFAFAKIRASILAQADSLRQEGFKVEFDSLKTSPWKNEISVRNLDVQFPVVADRNPDSTSFIRAKSISIEGLSLLQVIMHHEVHIRSIALKTATLRYSKADMPKKSKKSGKPSKLKGIYINDLTVNEAGLMLLDSATASVATESKLSFNMRNVSYSLDETSEKKITIGQADFDKVILHFPKTFYTFSIQHLAYHGPAQTIKIDSIELKPDYDKIEFAKKSRTQIDRIQAKIPGIDIRGVELLASQSDISARSMSLGFDIEIFHDKRYPSGPKKIKKLPSRMLHDLRMRFQIDTVTLSKSSVTYDEFPAEGQKAGEVSFNDLHATILNVSNISSEHMSMKTSARFMNAGNLEADFTFPSNPEKPYTIAGKLTDFNMPEINRILVPIANVEVKAGKLHNMQFNYQYNEYRSDGILTMHYTDLDVASLIKGSKNKETNKFLTLILQKFIIKKDMDKNKSQGTILYYHDPERSTFNFWWKSILSGVKSLYNLDKITDTHHSKKK